MGIVARELRERFDLMALKTSWMRFGLPDDLPGGPIGERESRHGIHGGDYETSVMLALAPELVRTEHAGRFDSAAERAADAFAHIAPDRHARLGLARRGPAPRGRRRRRLERRPPSGDGPASITRPPGSSSSCSSSAGPRSRTGSSRAERRARRLRSHLATGRHVQRAPGRLRRFPPLRRALPGAASCPWSSAWPCRRRHPAWTRRRTSLSAREPAPRADSPSRAPCGVSDRADRASCAGG